MRPTMNEPLEGFVHAAHGAAGDERARHMRAAHRSAARLLQHLLTRDRDAVLAELGDHDVDAPQAAGLLVL